jgi:hypothetical protein
MMDKEFDKWLEEKRKHLELRGVEPIIILSRMTSEH